MPAAYADYAGRFMRSMQSPATVFTTESAVAEAVFSAATDESPTLRYPLLVPTA